MPSPSRDAPARLLADRFELREVLGRGGMATVWSAHDRRLDRQVAIKVLRPDLPPADALRIEREARAAARISDRRVVTVLDLDHTDDGTPFLVMEAHGGHTLADDLRAGPLSPARSAQLVDDLVGALAAAHAEGVLHRDIKPANVLSDPDGFRLTDFGIASIDDDLETSGDLVGTLAYIAPERFAGGQATPRSDVFSLGTVLYEAFSGRQPFRGSSPADTMRRLREGVITPLPGHTPAPVARIVELALSPDPTRRPADGLAVQAALADIGHTPTEAIAIADPTERLDQTAVLAFGPVADAPPAHVDGGEPALGTVTDTVDRVARRAVDSGRHQAGRFRSLSRDNPPAAIAVVAATLVVLIVLATLVGLGGGTDSSETDVPATPQDQLEADLERIEELGR